MKDFIRSLLILFTVLSSATGDKVVYAQENGTVTLPMSTARTVESRTYVTWRLRGSTDTLINRNAFGNLMFGEDERWKNRLSLSGYSLIIENIQPDDFQTFTCEVKQGLDVISTNTFKLSKVTVRMNPAAPLLVGSSMSLTCEVEGNAKPAMHWLNPKGQREVQGASGGRLTVNNVNDGHNGEWTCVITSDGKEDKAKISVMVLDLSEASSYPCYTSVSSYKLIVPCSIPTGLSWENFKAKGLLGGHWRFVSSQASNSISRDPQKLVSLSFGDTPTSEAVHARFSVPDLSKKNLSLWMNHPTEADRGDYVCALELEGGVTLKRSVHVEVLQIQSPSGVNIPAGQPFNLTCSLGRALPPDLRVKWTLPRRSALSSLGVDPDSENITVPEAVDGAHKRWRCELWRNGTRLTSDEIRLNFVKPPIRVWLLVTICGAVVIFILFLILTVILLRRHRQRKMTPRHHKHRFCQCKNPKPKGFYRS